MDAERFRREALDRDAARRGVVAPVPEPLTGTVGTVPSAPDGSVSAWAPVPKDAVVATPPEGSTVTVDEWSTGDGVLRRLEVTVSVEAPPSLPTPMGSLPAAVTAPDTVPSKSSAVREVSRFELSRFGEPLPVPPPGAEDVVSLDDLPGRLLAATFRPIEPLPACTGGQPPAGLAGFADPFGAYRRCMHDAVVVAADGRTVGQVLAEGGVDRLVPVDACPVPVLGPPQPAVSGGGAPG